jgi:hypothetical protein
MTRDNDHWRTIPELRIRVVYWLLSCAISEAYAEDQGEENLPSTTKKKESSGAILIPEKVDDFPLGFSTCDVQVDRILTLLRMQFLAELEVEQKEQNDFLATKIQEKAASRLVANEGGKRKQQDRRKRK